MIRIHACRIACPTVWLLRPPVGANNSIWLRWHRNNNINLFGIPRQFHSVRQRRSTATSQEIIQTHDIPKNCVPLRKRVNHYNTSTKKTARRQSDSHSKPRSHLQSGSIVSQRRNPKDKRFQPSGYRVATGASSFYKKQPHYHDNAASFADDLDAVGADSYKLEQLLEQGLTSTNQAKVPKKRTPPNPHSKKELALSHEVFKSTVRLLLKPHFAHLNNTILSAKGRTFGILISGLTDTTEESLFKEFAEKYTNLSLYDRELGCAVFMCASVPDMYRLVRLHNGREFNGQKITVGPFFQHYRQKLVRNSKIVYITSSDPQVVLDAVQNRMPSCGTVAHVDYRASASDQLYAFVKFDTLVGSLKYMLSVRTKLSCSTMREDLNKVEFVTPVDSIPSIGMSEIISDAELFRTPSATENIGRNLYEIHANNNLLKLVLKQKLSHAIIASFIHQDLPTDNVLSYFNIFGKVVYFVKYNLQRYMAAYIIAYENQADADSAMQNMHGLALKKICSDDDQIPTKAKSWRLHVAPFLDPAEAARLQKYFTAVYLSNLPDGCSAQDLRDQLAKYGPLTKIKLLQVTTGRRCAYVLFTSHGAAVEFVKATIVKSRELKSTSKHSSLIIATPVHAVPYDNITSEKFLKLADYHWNHGDLRKFIEDIEDYNDDAPENLSKFTDFGWSTRPQVPHTHEICNIPSAVIPRMLLKSSAKQVFSVHVSNLSNLVSTNTMLDIFGKAGEIINVQRQQITDATHDMIIDFEDFSAVNKAILMGYGLELGGRPLIVTADVGADLRRHTNWTYRSLVILSLPPFVTVSNMRRLLQRFGTVTSYLLQTSDNGSDFCYVEYKTVDEARYCFYLLYRMQREALELGHQYSGMKPFPIGPTLLEP
ncbi:hypothetical protein V1514DRAFT_354688 [Lipomyces japonicus]|uniref:uncharacterized protein n=1 Tax=Lipomyces japonicus TaxID=56871 RepID=UPI0034CDBC3F